MIDFERYFLNDQQFFLNSINYKTIEETEQLSEYRMKCTDSITVDLDIERGMRVIFTRELSFEPEALFVLEVSYGAILTFNPDTKDEFDWKKTDLAKEVQTSGGFVLRNIISKVSLLIAEITASGSQVPIVTPPNMIE